MRRLFFAWWYLFRPPWDSGIPAPELVRSLAGRPPGRALDIGCGTGTNVRYLVEQGWYATGIDYVPTAILKARRRTPAALSRATFLVGDATRLSSLPLAGPFDLALDMGCFHSLDAAGQIGYAAGLKHWLRPGAPFLLYAFQPDPARRLWGLTQEAVTTAFADGLRLTHWEAGQGRPSAWYFFERVAG